MANGGSRIVSEFVEFALRLLYANARNPELTITLANNAGSSALESSGIVLHALCMVLT